MTRPRSNAAADAAARTQTGPEGLGPAAPLCSGPALPRPEESADATQGLRAGPSRRTRRADTAPIRRIVRDLRPRARVMAVTSGKGGVGKTNLAVNLAIGLAMLGRRVLLVDADLGLANVDLVLGRRARGDLGHVLSGGLPLEQIVQEGPAGIRWIPGASHMPDVARISQRRREALLEGLTALETQHDFVLIDTPAGIGPGVLHVARQADELLLVTTPEPTAMMDAYTLLKAVAAGGAESLGRVRLIVNMVTHRRDAERAHERIDAVSRRFLGVSVGLLGHVFCDGHVGRAVQRQEPLVLAYPHSQAAWCVRRLAGAVLEAPEAENRPRFAFFGRLVRLFARMNRQNGR